jgi:hypothetical protein
MRYEQTERREVSGTKKTDKHCYMPRGCIKEERREKYQNLRGMKYERQKNVLPRTFSLYGLNSSHGTLI